MADLLECLLQIKGLRETTHRLSALVQAVERARWLAPSLEGGASPADLLAWLAEIESVYGAWLRSMLASSCPALDPVDDAALLDSARRRSWRPDEALDHFLSRRRANLEMLDRCRAADFSRTGLHPTRREMTVADVVAVMMASDAERVGEIRRTLNEGGSRQ